MTAPELIRILASLGVEEVRKGKGPHVRFRVTRDGVTCSTTVSVHKGRDIPRGTLRGIEKDLAPALGEGWLAPLIRGR